MGKKKILIVDDEPDIVQTVRYALEDEGYEVDSGASGEEGLRKLEEGKPDLILLDVLLPDQNGFHVAQKIKAMDAYKDIPIVAISCKTDQVDKRVAVRSGVMEYIDKPIDVDRLLFLIKDILIVHKK
ncbi:MAG: response regulator [Candidatus Omnitrophota bacterium]|nr:response regulator [Candidatus Omnitrophota bacterium]